MQSIHSIQNMVQLPSQIISLDSFSSETSQTVSAMNDEQKIRHEHKRSENEVELNKIMNDIKRLKRKQMATNSIAN